MSLLVTGIATVRKVFEKRTLDSGTEILSFSVKYKESDKRDSQVVVSVFGDFANELELDEGDVIFIHGRLSEQRWQNKETEEWSGRHDVVATKIIQVADLEDGPLDD